jgi:hypothetical protein
MAAAQPRATSTRSTVYSTVIEPRSSASRRWPGRESSLTDPSRPGQEGRCNNSTSCLLFFWSSSRRGPRFWGRRRGLALCPQRSPRLTDEESGHPERLGPSPSPAPPWGPLLKRNAPHAPAHAPVPPVCNGDFASSFFLGAAARPTLETHFACTGVTTLADSQKSQNETHCASLKPLLDHFKSGAQ